MNEAAARVMPRHPKPTSFDARREWGQLCLGAFFGSRKTAEVVSLMSNNRQIRNFGLALGMLKVTKDKVTESTSIPKIRNSFSFNL